MNKNALALVLLTTLLVSVAQVFYKFGVKSLSLSFSGIFLNYFLVIGLLLYVIGAVILLFALKKEELSTVYPVIATGYIWVLLFSNFFFGEELNYLKWLGVGAIVCGITFVGFGSSGVKNG
jgi:drug/metabolite transporter (DMT)-like permease